MKLKRKKALQVMLEGPFDQKSDQLLLYQNHMSLCYFCALSQRLS